MKYYWNNMEKASSSKILIMSHDDQIRSKKHLKHMYLECFDGIVDYKDFEYHIELDPKFKQNIQSPHQIEKQGIID